MILPTKHIRLERTLLGVGAVILQSLRRPMTISRLWDTVRSQGKLKTLSDPITYEWFILALDMLYALQTITLDKGVLRRAEQ